MTIPARKLLVIVAALVALIMAGAAGAVVRYTIFTIQTNQSARLSGTNVYCQHLLAQPYSNEFLCAVWGPRHGVPNAYGFYIAQGGLFAVRWSSNGKTLKSVRDFK